MQKLFFGISLAASVVLMDGRGAAAESAVVTNRFGFAGKEVFPIDNGVSQLRAADLNGDGLEDLIVVNNQRSKINLLYNRTGRTNEIDPKAVRREINDLPPDARFSIESVASEKRISSLVVADLNGDNRADLAYYGEPKELIAQFYEGTNSWSNPKRWPIADGLLNPNALVAGDVNGDKRMDLLLLAEGFVYILTQTEDHTLAEPQKVPYTGSVQAVQVLDIEGNGRDDLLLVNWDSPNPFRFRLQNSSGQLGPEVHFLLPPIRSYWADDLDADQKTEIVTIAQKSGRAQISNFTKRPAEQLSGSWKEGQFQILPLNKTTKAKRGMVWADVSSDGLPDLLVAEPDSGQLTLYLQNLDGSLSASKTFATLTGVSDLGVADWDGDNRPEIFLLSVDERQIGVSHFGENGRIEFPEMISFTGRPLVMAVGTLAEGGKPVLATIVDQEGKRELQIRRADGSVASHKLSEKFKSNPSSISVHDADQNGRPDLVVLIPYEKIKVLLQGEEGEFDEQDVAPPGGIIDQPWMATADVDGDGKPEGLLAQRNFLRAVVLVSGEKAKTNATWSFSVKDQINGRSSNSRIVAAASLRNGTNKVASVFLLDAEQKTLTLSERDGEGVWQVVRSLPLTEVAYSRMEALSIATTNQANSIALIGLGTVAWLPLTGEVWSLVELDGYETPIRDGYLTDVVSGDLNQDGRKDLVFLETAKSYIDIVTFESPHQLVPANRWQVFEERTFRSRRSERPEPREALITDVTNDKKNDLVVVVHDRVILYPQE